MTRSSDSSVWGGSDDGQLMEKEHNSIVEMSEDMRNQHSVTGQGERVISDTVDFGREAGESVDSDGEEDSGEVDDSPPGEMSSSEEDELRKETSSDDEELYEVGDKSDSIDYVGMTSQQREAMYHAVKNGDIDLLDDLLDLPYANIQMEWFGESLLMAAIRANQQEMAEFLLDNGVDPNFETTLVDMRNARKGNVDCYTIDCRQMAYDHNNFDLVNLIDEINGMLWPFVKQRKRVIRKKKPLVEKLREKLESENKIIEDKAEREYSGPSIRQPSESKLKKKVRIQTEPLVLPDTSFTEDKRKRELAQTTPRLLTTPMLETSLEDQCTNCTLPELSEVNQATRRTYVYKYTRDFLARKKARERQKKDQQANNAGQHSVRNKWYPSKYDNNLANAQQNATMQGLRFINGPDVSKPGIQSPTRLLSPWQEDDEVLLRHLKSRSGQFSYRAQKPVLSRKQALLPLLPERTTPKTLHRMYDGCRASPQPSTVKAPMREFSPVANEWARHVHSEAAKTPPSPTVATPVLPTKGRPGRSRTAVTTSKSNDKYQRAKTRTESTVYRKTVKWDFDIDPLVPPTLVRFTAPPSRSLQELEDTIEYNVPMAASLAYS